MVLVQPNVSLEPAGTSGFRIGQIERTTSTDTIRNICDYLQTHRGQHYDHASFVILPELSVTEEGFYELEQYVRADTCPSNTIVIAGLEGLPWHTYESLLERSDNPEEAKYKPPKDTVDWVNCFVTFVKQDNAQGITEVKILDDLNANAFFDLIRGLVTSGQRFLIATCDLHLYRMALEKFACLNTPESQRFIAYRLSGVSKNGPKVIADAPLTPTVELETAQ